MQPVQITRIDADHYVVGQIHLVRFPDGWQARVWPIAKEQRPLFTADTLEEILELAHQAVEMFRPADV